MYSVLFNSISSLPMDLETWVSASAGGTSDCKIVGEDKPAERMDQNACMERKESTKGNSDSTNLNPSSHSSTTSSSQRYFFNFKSKTAILRMLKPHNPGFVDAKNRKPGAIRFFPKRPRSGGKSDTCSMTEPASPEVSCIGRVRSNKGLRMRNRKSTEAKEKPKKTEKRKTGFSKCFLPDFGCACKKKSALKSNQPLPVDQLPRKSEARRARGSTRSEPEPPGLGGMRRFVSGRKSESWVGEAAERG